VESWPLQEKRCGGEGEERRERVSEEVDATRLLSPGLGCRGERMRDLDERKYEPFGSDTIELIEEQNARFGC